MLSNSPCNPRCPVQRQTDPASGHWLRDSGHPEQDKWFTANHFRLLACGPFRAGGNAGVVDPIDPEGWHVQFRTHS
jgi:hypothetical protein